MLSFPVCLKGTEAAYANPLTNATKEQSAMKWIEKLFEKQISWSDGSTYHKSNSEIKRSEFELIAVTRDCDV